MRTKVFVGITVLLVFGLLWISGHAADTSSRLPKGLRSSIGLRSPIDTASADRIVSILNGLRKNLILESTRAEKDVDIYRKNAAGVVYIETETGSGSGIIIDVKGRVITNWHVVGNNQTVFLAFKPKDGSDLTNDLVFTATVEKIDEVTDLALLKIITPPKSLTVLKLGDASKLAVGQDVSAIGHPAGLVWTYTKGIISQLRSNYEVTTQGIVHRANVIQTQTPINPGNSGGPLLDSTGKLIGINTWSATGKQGLNYSVAVDEVHNFLQRPGRTAPRQAPSLVQAEPSCPESYDTRGQRWSDIIGCYNNRTTPPPDHWVVFSAPKTVHYIAANLFTGGNIDTLITNLDPNWQNQIYALDTNCDGVIDLIGQANGGKPDLSSFRSPSQNSRLVSFTGELDAALKTGKIPHPQMRVCQ